MITEASAQADVGVRNPCGNAKTAPAPWERGPHLYPYERFVTSGYSFTSSTTHSTW